jgi:hypothetical protein
MNVDASNYLSHQLNKGEGLRQQAKNSKHAIVCIFGLCVVKTNNFEKVIKVGSQPVNLMAGEEYKIEGLEDGTVFMTVFAEGKN